jgi:hypothetical protein
MSVFWYLKFDFSAVDYAEYIPVGDENNYGKFKGNVFNLLEMYSSNVNGNIALGIKIYLKKIKRVGMDDYEYTETFEVNFGGIIHIYEITPTLKVDHKIYFNDDKYHLLTFLKYIDDGRDYIKMTIDDEYDFLDITEINYQHINFVSNRRNNIILSRENFILNKQSDGKMISQNEYHPLKIHLVCFGIINKAVQQNRQTHTSIISKLKKHMSDQFIRLSPLFLENERYRIDAEGENIKAKTCLMTQKVCDTCKGVDWSNMSSVFNSIDCSKAILERCDKIRVEQLDASEDEKALCSAIKKFQMTLNEGNGSRPPTTPTASESGTNPTGSTAKCVPSFDKLKPIIYDDLKRTDYNTGPITQESDLNIQRIDYDNLNDNNYASKYILHPITKSPIGTHMAHTHRYTHNKQTPSNDFDEVSQSIMEGPVRNMTYNELNRIVNAKRNDRDGVSERELDNLENRYKEKGEDMKDPHQGLKDRLFGKEVTHGATDTHRKYHKWIRNICMNVS